MENLNTAPDFMSVSKKKFLYLSQRALSESTPFRKAIFTIYI